MTPTRMSEAEKERLSAEGVKFCVVDGQGSHRDDWGKTTTVGGVTYVACDHHSDEEFNDAINVAEKERQDKANAPGGSKLVTESAKTPAAKPGQTLSAADKIGTSAADRQPQRSNASPGPTTSAQASKPPDSGSVSGVANATPSKTTQGTTGTTGTQGTPSGPAQTNMPTGSTSTSTGTPSGVKKEEDNRPAGNAATKEETTKPTSPSDTTK